MSPTQPADRIFEGGTLLTMNDQQPTAEAIALQAGRILAVGTRADILALRGPDTEVVSLRGGTMIPAIVDDPTTTDAAASGDVEPQPQGTLEPGQRANFVVLSDNPLTLAPQAREDLRVLHIVKDGESLYLDNAQAEQEEDDAMFTEALFLDESGWLV
ncbi:amidohydrolase family protein [Myxococcus sp. K38C18041901]|uniref:amidohydrolase family protein n=1 Tax=Myxococcus guangdongensis TaxID=2906760 RepID=UPI0020A77310|nr:amidohydrolase family protein [Myxococcus guangdongensis]MCP3062790.1 amidohydrolase family protein [Myxococcus guangdongensis]